MNINLTKKQKVALEAKYKKRLRALLKPEIFKLCVSKGWYLPGKKSRCPMSRDILISVLAQTVWCAKISQVEEVEKPRRVCKAELWHELQQLIKQKHDGVGWPETILARGVTNQELSKYIYALKPDHRYFKEDFQYICKGGAIPDTDSDASYDSLFEEQFADLMKDLPSKLAVKIPKHEKQATSDGNYCNPSDQPEVYPAEAVVS